MASLALTVLCGLAFRPADLEVLVPFYAKVRPFGCWGPVRAEAARRGLVPPRDPMPWIDLLNGLLTAVFQAGLALTPFYLFLRRWPQMWFSLAVVSLMSVILYFTWYKNLPAADET